MNKLKFFEIIKKNDELGDSLKRNSKVIFKILSNITIHQLKPILEFKLRSEAINAVVDLGDYDNILQESTKSTKDDIHVIFWELCNIKNCFVYEIETFSEEQYQSFVEKLQNEISLLFKNLKASKLVLFNNFSHLAFTSNNLKVNNYERLATELNEFISKNLPQSFIRIDIDKILVRLSAGNSVDLKNFYNSKSLYTIEFLKAYTDFIVPVVYSTLSKSRKAIIVDCDNTLWQGIIGEDGWENVALSETHKKGIYFKEVQFILKALAKNGIILGLCSKNNLNDVEELFLKREDSILKSEDIVIKKINWKSKSENLIEIAKELNIGIDSMVYLDDSAFEISMINNQLPLINTIQVPDELYNYPGLINSNLPLFYSSAITNEDIMRTKMYRDELARKNSKLKFQNIDDYLASLGIEIILENKNSDTIDRIAQLTQKTNQFNLTTKRYLKGDIQIFFNSAEYDVVGIRVNDKYGSYGLVGICIIKFNKDLSSEIDSLLLSCRVLGRNIEKVFIKEIIKKISEKGYRSVYASYIKTSKNEQVEHFYSDLNFNILNQSNTETKYRGEVQMIFHELDQVNYVKVIWKND